MGGVPHHQARRAGPRCLARGCRAGGIAVDGCCRVVRVELPIEMDAMEGGGEWGRDRTCAGVSGADSIANGARDFAHNAPLAQHRQDTGVRS